MTARHYGLRTDYYWLLVITETSDWNSAAHQHAPSDVTSVFGKERESKTRQEEPEGDVAHPHDTLAQT